jgi:multiple sugar transport system permease protein
MRRRSFAVRTVQHLLLAAIVVVFLGPVVWFFLLAIRPVDTDFTIPPVLLFKPTLQAFAYTFLDPGINRSNIGSSLIQAGGATLIALPLIVLAAYGFSRFKFPGNRPLFFWYLGLLLSPPIIFLMPYYLLMARVGLLGTHAAVILVYQTFAIPLGVWLLKGFIDDIPVDIEEAAMVDGAGRLRILQSVTLPLAAPGLIVTGMFVFVFSWNNAIFPLVLTNQRTAPLPIGTLSFFATAGITWNYIAATSVVTMLPPMIIFLLLRGYVAKGLSFGALKG